MSQELWELELPFILGLAHPRLSADRADSDAGWDDLSPTEVDDSGPVHAASPLPASSGYSAPPPVPASTSTPAASSTVSDGATSPIIIDADAETPADQDALATQVYAPTEPDSGVWSDMDRPAQGFHTYELHLDTFVLPPAPAPGAPRMELLAFSVCSRRSCTAAPLRT